MGDLTEAAGVRLVVHPQDNIPFPEDRGMSLHPGVLTYVGVRLVRFSKIKVLIDRPRCLRRCFFVSELGG